MDWSFGGVEEEEERPLRFCDEEGGAAARGSRNMGRKQADDGSARPVALWCQRPDDALRCGAGPWIVWSRAADGFHE